MIFYTHELVLGNMTCGLCAFCQVGPTPIPQGCVYLKMDSLKSAMGAYKALHGGWYKGEGDV